MQKTENLFDKFSSKPDDEYKIWKRLFFLNKLILYWQFFFSASQSVQPLPPNSTKLAMLGAGIVDYDHSKPSATKKVQYQDNFDFFMSNWRDEQWTSQNSNLSTGVLEATW